MADTQQKANTEINSPLLQNIPRTNELSGAGAITVHHYNNTYLRTSLFYLANGIIQSRSHKD